MKISLLILVCVLRESVAQVDPTLEGEKHTFKLKEEQFKTLIEQTESNEPWVVLFQSPSCLQCYDYRPKLYKNAFKHKSEKINFATVDCDEEKNLCRRMRISRYPTLYTIREDNKYYPFNGNLEEANLDYFITEGWMQGEGYVVPKNLPWMIEDFYVSMKEINKEIRAILRSKGNYLAKITLLVFFIIVTVVSIMTCISVRDCLVSQRPENFNYKEIKRKRTERENTKAEESKKSK